MSDQTTNDATTDQTTTDATTGTPPEQGDTQKVTFTPEQQAEINKLIGSARREGKQSAAEEAAEAKRKADEEAERERQIKAGEFDTVRQSLEAERDAALTKAAQFDALVETIRPEVDAQWAALPGEVTELYEGDADDVLAKRAHMARCKKLIDKLAAQQETKKQAAGFGRTPTPNGSGSTLEKGLEEGRRTGKYTA